MDLANFNRIVYRTLVIGGVMMMAPWGIYGEDGTEVLRLSSGHFSHRPQKESFNQQVVGKFEKFVIDFHDNFLLSLWQNQLVAPCTMLGMTFPGDVLINDLIDLGILVSGKSNLNGVELAGLLVNHFITLSNYQSAISGFCTPPTNALELRSECQTTGQLLANFFISRGNFSSSETPRLHRLFADWTNAYLDCLNNAAPQCTAPALPVNAAVSNVAYTQVRGLTFRIAQVIAVVFDEGKREKRSVGKWAKELPVLLVNQTVYFHDYAFAVIECLPSDFFVNDDALLHQNASSLGAAIAPQNPTVAAQLTALFIAYASAGEAFVNALNISKNVNDPTVQDDLQVWLAAADQLAIALSQLHPKSVPLSEMQTLWKEYTLLQADMIDNLLTTAANNPDFSKAAALYAAARRLAVERLAPLIGQGLSNERGRP